MQFGVTLVAGIAAFMIQFAGLIWRVSKAESRISARISEVEHELEVDIQRLKTELVETKLNISENYLKKEAFHIAMGNIDSRLIRLEGKLDTVIART